MSFGADKISKLITAFCSPSSNGYVSTTVCNHFIILAVMTGSQTFACISRYNAAVASNSLKTVFLECHV